jgi:hypothetical protein
VIDFKLAKAAFFDRPVVKAVKDKGKAVLGRFGAFVRRDGRKSIKTAPRVPAEKAAEYRLKLRLWAAGRIARKPDSPERHSPPGSPPLAHRKNSPIRLILFAYDAREQSVVIGPAAFGGHPGEATHALEYGGASTSGGRPIRVAARPTMTPAFQKNLPHLRNWRRAA